MGGDSVTGGVPAQPAASTLFKVPTVKEALFLLLGEELDEVGKEKWLALRPEVHYSDIRIFAEALHQIDGMVTT